MPKLDPKIIQIIEQQLQVNEDEITPGASFMDDLGADSLDIVELVMQFEETFDIIISDEDADSIRTVQDSADVIERMTKRK